MAKHTESLSVLVVDKTPTILVFLARLFQTDNIRALLARDSQEACGIAERDYVPMDLVLANIVVPGLDAYQLMTRLREIRPGLRALYMTARLHRGVISVKLMVGPGLAEAGDLIRSVRSASHAPLARAAGATPYTAGWTVQ